MPQANSINDYKIKEDLSKSDCETCKDALKLIKTLERVIESNDQLRAKAIGKIREQGEIIKTLHEHKNNKNPF